MLDSQVGENCCQIKFSSAIFEKIQSFVCLVLKYKIKRVLKFQSLFSFKLFFKKTVPGCDVYNKISKKSTKKYSFC